MKRIQTSISLLILICTVLLLIYFNNVAAGIYHFACQYFAADHEIQYGIPAIRVRLLMLIFLLFFLFIISILSRTAWFKTCFRQFFFNPAVKHYFLDPPAFHYRLFLFASVSSTLLTFLFSIKQLPGLILLYGEDHFFEWLTVALLLLSAVLLILSIRKLIFLELKQNELRIIRSVLILLSFLLFVMAMEELSWGQRIFNWDADSFGGNFQKETNLHNYFNPDFKIIYPLFGYSIFLLLIISWIPEREHQSVCFNTPGMAHGPITDQHLVIRGASYEEFFYGCIPGLIRRRLTWMSHTEIKTLTAPARMKCNFSTLVTLLNISAFFPGNCIYIRVIFCMYIKRI